MFRQERIYGEVNWSASLLAVARFESLTVNTYIMASGVTYNTSSTHFQEIVAGAGTL